MHDIAFNLQRLIHVKHGLEHVKPQAKHVKLSRDLPSLNEKLSSFRAELPSFAENFPALQKTCQHKRKPTLILSERNTRPANNRLPNPNRVMENSLKEQLCQESN
jgi:hypothetical protein